MFLKRLKEDVATAQKVFGQNSLEVAEFIVSHSCGNCRCTKSAIVVDTFLAAVVYIQVCSPK